LGTVGVLSRAVVFRVFSGLTFYFCFQCCREILSRDKRPLDWDVAGKPIAIIYLLTIPYVLLLLLLEYSADGGAGGVLGRLLRQVRGTLETVSLRWHGVRQAEDGTSLLLEDGLDTDGERAEDDDVAEECSFVKQNKNALKDEASVLLVDLWKVYPPSVGMFGSIFASLRRTIGFIFCHWWRRGHRSEDNEERAKAFPPKRAVRGLTTAITEGETYGLLGVS